MYEVNETILVTQLNDLAKSGRVIFGKYLTTWNELEKYDAIKEKALYHAALKIYDDIGKFHGYDITWANLNGKFFHVDRDLRPIYEGRYDDVGLFFDYDTTWAELDGKYFHIGRNGKPIYDERYDEVEWFDNYSITKVLLGSDTLYINRKGKILEPIEKVYNIGSGKRNLLIFDHEGKYLFVTGCFIGTLDEFKAAVIEKHAPNSKHHVDYMEVIKRYEEASKLQANVYKD